MESRTKIAVAGGTGRVGTPLVEILEKRGHEVVPIARSTGVDVITGEGLDEALKGVDVIVDAATGPSPDQEEATRFFETATANLQAAGERAGVKRMVVVSIIGIDKFTGGYNAAKLVQEKFALNGPVPVHILRASQFHEFVAELVKWSTQGDVAYVPKMKTQVVEARVVAEALADLAENVDGVPTITEIAGPREESLIELARLLVAKQGSGLRVEPGEFPGSPDGALYESGAALPGPDVKLAGPTYEAWLAKSTVTA